MFDFVVYLKNVYSWKKQFVTYILYHLFKYILKINNVYISISDVIYIVNLNFIGVKQK